MYKIDISYEAADDMFRDILIKDYKGLREQLRSLESAAQLLDYEREDLEDTRRWVNAMEVLMEYYLSHEERLEVLGETGQE